MMQEIIHYFCSSPYFARLFIADSLRDMAGDPDKSTLGEVVYSALRTSILAGELKPGQRLKVSALSAEHGVSLNVVREALNRLTGEQLVRALPKIGFAVADLSVEGLSDLMAVRIAVETAALQWAIERGDMAWESQVVAAHYRLAKTQEIEGEPPVLRDEWMQAHSDFHAQLLSACGSPRMIEITRSLSDAAQIYRRWSLSLSLPERDLPDEHAALVEAVLAHDAHRAMGLLTAHIKRTRDTVLIAIAAKPEPSSDEAAVSAHARQPSR
jgi:GntR family transcriptional regulator, carbon starvation induced regulator